MPTLRALVIDDSRVMRAVVMRGLQAAGLGGWAFAEAEDGADALAKFDPNTVDICFVDWNMPTMTGVEFVRRAKAVPGGAGVPMVMVTSERKAAKMDEALAGAGADAYVCKPFTPAELKDKLQGIVDRLAAGRPGGRGAHAPRPPTHAAPAEEPAP